MSAAEAPRAEPRVRRYVARWVLPISRRPLENGAVLVHGDRVVDVGPVAPSADAATVDLGNVALLPGLVNAHTHLELSWMRGAIPPSHAMPLWASRLMALRRSAGPVPDPGVEAAVEEMRGFGTALVGDISNTLASVEPIEQQRMRALVFFELIGFRWASSEASARAVAERVRTVESTSGIHVSVAAHAPYSVSAALIADVRAAAGALGAPYSVHVAESVEELEFLREGTGPWRTILEELGSWTAGWIPPRVTPVEYLDRLGFWSDKALAVHAVHVTDDDLACLARRGATIVTCPRSNAWTGAGAPPVGRYHAAGVRVAVGTDSLASVADLNLFAELAALRRLAPEVPARWLLTAATLSGAHALGFGDEVGAIEPGKRAALIAVDVPEHVPDVEEYLVSGVDASSVHWLDELSGRAS